MRVDRDDATTRRGRNGNAGAHTNLPAGGRGAERMRGGVSVCTDDLVTIADIVNFTASWTIRPWLYPLNNYRA
jgi:hypothetical protein